MFTDFSTSRCVRARCAVKDLGVAPRLLLQGGKAKIDARQSLGDDIM